MNNLPDSNGNNVEHSNSSSGANSNSGPNSNSLTLHISLENMKNNEKNNALIPLLAMNRSISSSFRKKSNSFFSDMVQIFFI